MPLRTICRWDIPLDASPRFRARCERIKRARDKYGAHRTYFLDHGNCRLRLSNHPNEGAIDFIFFGPVVTDDADRRTIAADLSIDVRSESLVWINDGVLTWLKDTVSRAVMLEFDRYIACGNAHHLQRRCLLPDLEWEYYGGFVGMGI